MKTAIFVVLAYLSFPLFAQTQEDIDAAAQALVDACAAAKDQPTTGLCGSAMVMMGSGALTPEQIASLREASSKAAQASTLANEAANLIDEVLMEVAPQ